ncbi:hypothetical protein [Catenulispora rubra]|uniref:hypothetical protein n=1 Tax=Catenulispora rubra TaxID=280293 RepID=UPI0018927966|nr:hypothetical protein [Catenulispora rubra]
MSPEERLALNTQKEREAQQALVRLLRDNNQFLADAGYPGTVRLELWRLDVVSRRQSKREVLSRVPLPAIRAWQMPERYGQRDRWLGTDGRVHATWHRYLKQGGLYEHPEWTLLEPGDDYQFREMLQFVSRLLRHYGAPGAPHASRLMFFAPSSQTAQGNISSIRPRPALQTQAQSRYAAAESRCEDPCAMLVPGADTARWNSDTLPAGRQGQLRYLLLSWLREYTLGAGGDIDGFLVPDPPLIDGGPVRADEVIAMITELVTGGEAEWIDELSPTRFTKGVLAAVRLPEADRFAEIVPEDFWGHLVWNGIFRITLRETGLREAEGYAASLVTSDYAHALRVALLTWISQNAKQGYFVRLSAFCNASASRFGAFPVTQADVWRTARWLSYRGYVNLSQDGAGATLQGLTCVEHYGGDPDVMSEAQLRGQDHRSIVFHGPTGNVAIDAQDFIQVSGRIDTRSDCGSMLRQFAAAIVQALPALGLTAEQQTQVREIGRHILDATEAEPNAADHSTVIRSLASTLHDILEGVVDNALTTTLLDLWHP